MGPPNTPRLSSSFLVSLSTRTASPSKEYDGVSISIIPSSES